MSSNKRNSLFIAGIVLLGVTAAAEAQAPLGTRAAGLAGAFVGVADDASAVYWNPAGLATGAIVRFLATFSDDITAPDDAQDVTGEQLTGRMVGLSALPIGIAYYRSGVYGTTRVSEVTGLQSREEVRRSVHALTTSTVGVSLLHSLTEYIVVGATPKVTWGSALGGEATGLSINEGLDAARDLDGPVTTVFDIDAAAMIAVQRVRLGVVARNLTTPSFPGPRQGADGQADGGEEIEISREVRIGAAWGSQWPGHSRVIVSIDGDLTSRATPFGDRRDVAAGVETWWLDRRLGLRGGIRGSTVGETRGAVAAGISGGLTPGMMLEAHVLFGQFGERGWSIGVRAGF
jgi:hypothetical protein